MFTKVVVLLLFAAAPVIAQVVIRPTDPPLVTAESEQWFALREPLHFAGEMYYPAGPAVFFDGNVMARIGHYNGVPVYADTTIEPYSIVLVPARRGLMQPYERRRQGDLVGTTGSRTPAFPVSIWPVPGRGVQQAPAPPTQHPLPIGAIGAFTPQAGTVVMESNEPMEPPPASRPSTAENLGAPARPRSSDAPTMLNSEVLRRAENNDGIWIQFRGEKWVTAGKAVPLRSSEFRAVGQYAGFPVFARNGSDEVIYLPTRGGLVAPYRMK